MKTQHVLAAMGAFAWTVLGVVFGSAGITRGQCMEWALSPRGAAELLTEIPGVVRAVEGTRTVEVGEVLCAVAWDPDGAGPEQEWLVVGGSFTHAGKHVRTTNMAAWTGSSWVALGAGLDGEVRALEVVDGKIVAGGFFQTSGGIEDGVLTGPLAEWTGTSWQAFRGGLRATRGVIAGFVNDISWDGSSLYVVGRFDQAGGPGNEVTVQSPAVWRESWSSFSTRLERVNRIEAWRTPQGVSRVGVEDEGYIDVYQDGVWIPVSAQWPPATWWGVHPTGGVEMYYYYYIGVGGNYGTATLFWDGVFGTAQPQIPMYSASIDISSYLRIVNNWVVVHQRLHLDSVLADYRYVRTSRGHPDALASGEVHGLIKWRDRIVMIGEFTRIDQIQVRSVAIQSATGSWEAIGSGCSSFDPGVVSGMSASEGNTLVWNRVDEVDEYESECDRSFMKYENGVWRGLPTPQGMCLENGLEFYEGGLYTGTWLVPQGNVVKLENNNWTRVSLPLVDGQVPDSYTAEIGGTQASLIIDAYSGFSASTRRMFKYSSVASMFTDITSQEFGNVHCVAEIGSTLYSVPRVQPFEGEFGLGVYRADLGWSFKLGPFTSAVTSLTSWGTRLLALETSGRVWLYQGDVWSEITPEDVGRAVVNRIKVIDEGLYYFYEKAQGVKVVGRWRDGQWQQFAVPVNHEPLDFHAHGDGVVVQFRGGNLLDVPGATGFLHLQPGEGCSGDFDCDGVVNMGDVELFLGWFEAGSAGADVNQDGGVDGSDLAGFFELWEGGC